MTPEGYRHSKEARTKISVALRGKPKPWQIGKHHTEKTRTKMRASLKGHACPEKTRVKIREALKGRPNPRKGIPLSADVKENMKRAQNRSEVKEKRRMANIGRAVSKETREKIGQSLLGKPSGMLGKHQSKDSREKIRQSHLGSLNYNWKGGRSMEPYNLNWAKVSKREIAKAGGTCAWPGCTNLAKETHHINGNRKDDKPINLLPLCKKHHARITGHPKKSEQYELECIEIQILRRVS